MDFVKGKSTVSFIFSSDNFRLLRTLFIVNSQYSSHARIMPNLMNGKAPKIKTKEKAIETRQQRSRV